MFILLILVAVALASHAPSRPVRNTRTAVSTSRNTQSRGAGITPSPTIPLQLQRRSAATCGYVRGNSELPLACPDGYNCVNTMSIQPAWACCNDIECPGNWGFCNDYGASGCRGFNLDAALCSSVYGSALQCSQENPHCFRFARSSKLGDTMTYYSWACGKDSTDVLVLASATNGNKNDPSPDATSENLLTIPGLTSNMVLPTYPPLPGQTDSSSNGNNTPSLGSPKKPPLSTTAIVLICLFAGGSLVGALAIGCWCLRRKHQIRKNRVRHGRAPDNMPYTQTVTNGTGSIYSWNLGVPNGAPQSTYSGPTVTNYPLSEMSNGTRR